MGTQPKAIGHVTAVDGAKVVGLFHHEEHELEGFNLCIGAIIKVATPNALVFGSISDMAVTDPTGTIGDKAPHRFSVELIGEIPIVNGNTEGLGFQRGVADYPVLDQEIYPAAPDELARIFAHPERACVRIGTVHPTNERPVFLTTDDLLGKHFAVVGSTGSGKSCATALILRSLLEEYENGHVVMLDPHNEYTQAFGEIADVLNPDNLQLPYWLLNFEEMVEVMIGRRTDSEVQAGILKQAIVASKKKFAGEGPATDYITVDTPVPYSLSELVKEISHQMGHLDNPESTAPYLRLKARLENLRADRRYAFMFSGLVVRDSLTEIVSRILSIPVKGRPITIFDLSGVPSEIVDVAVSVMCRLIFDFALWSVPARALPVLLVCEEAHRYVPHDPSMGFGPTRKAIARMAMEGRKYGVSLCLVSQRPSELSPNILSQCSTLFALRMSNERDQEVVRRALPEAALGLLNALPSLRTQEAIAVGEGVVLPLRLRFDDLAEAHRPKGGNAEFARRWKREDAPIGLVEQTVDQWRMQLRTATRGQAAAE